MKGAHNDILRHQIDKQTAIRNMGGMTWLYEKHVSKFCREYSGAAVQISEMLARGETGEARILAHSIKGLSGTLGFYGLQQAAAGVETDIIHNGYVKNSSLVDFTFHMNYVIHHTHKE